MSMHSVSGPLPLHTQCALHIAVTLMLQQADISRTPHFVDISRRIDVQCCRVGCKCAEESGCTPRVMSELVCWRAVWHYSVHF